MLYTVDVMMATDYFLYFFDAAEEGPGRMDANVCSALVVPLYEVKTSLQARNQFAG